MRTPQGCPSPWRRPGQALIGDRQYYGRVFEHELVEWGVQLLGPARKSEPLRAGFALFEPFRQIIESVDQLQGPDRP
ncbi:hypothetical protein ACIPLC_30590 [Kitasatospora sp. NPDC086801]|uniref:hypothetical protein n=1 Tax=Kitasatospora sp. NPDC086801 TaxID=3364066 RepID=UPI0038033920